MLDYYKWNGQSRRQISIPKNLFQILDSSFMGAGQVIVIISNKYGDRCYQCSVLTTPRSFFFFSRRHPPGICQTEWAVAIYKWPHLKLQVPNYVYKRSVIAKKECWKFLPSCQISATFKWLLKVPKHCQDKGWMGHFCNKRGLLFTTLILFLCNKKETKDYVWRCFICTMCMYLHRCKTNALIVHAVVRNKL